MGLSCLCRQYHSFHVDKITSIYNNTNIMFTNENKLLRQLPGKSIEALKGTEKNFKETENLF